MLAGAHLVHITIRPNMQLPKVQSSGQEPQPSSGVADAASVSSAVRPQVEGDGRTPAADPDVGARKTEAMRREQIDARSPVALAVPTKGSH